MAPKSRKSAPKPKQGPKRPTIQRYLLDARTRAYAALLADPCNAALVAPCMSAGGDGYLTRFDTDYIINNTATDTGSMGYFCPGNICSTIATNSFGYAAGPIVSDTTTYGYTGAVGSQPGWTFLNANTNACRCIAACIQVSYVGSEQLRSGVIAVGQATFNSLNDAVTSTNQLRMLASNVVRTPDGVVEQRLVPTAASERWADPKNVFNTANTEQPAIFWSVSGLPVSTGIRVRMVAVYEWIPAPMVGISAGSAAKNAGPSTSLQAVTSAMSKLGDWAFSSSPSAQVARGVASALMSL